MVGNYGECSMFVVFIKDGVFLFFKKIMFFWGVLRKIIECFVFVFSNRCFRF